MADLAVIGIEARSDSLVTATKNLDQLSASAHKADAAVDSFNASAQATAPAATGMTRATNASIMAMNAQASAAQAMQRGTRLSANEMRNLSFQLNDVAVSLASGMNPMMVMAQQGSQIAQVFGPGMGVTGILRGMVETIWTMAKPFLPVIAVVGLLGAALGTVKDDAERMTSATVGWGHMIQGVFAEAGARIKGVMQPAFDFIEWGMGEVGKAVIYAGNLIINSFRAAYADIVFIFNAIPLAVEGSLMIVVNGFIRNINLMIKTAAQGINVLIAGANKLGASFDLLPVGDILTEKPNNALVEWGKLVDKRNADTARIMGEDPLGGFLQGAAKRAAGFAEADAAKVGGRKGRSTKEERDPYQELIRSQRQYIDGLILERDSLFMTEEAASRLRIEQELLNKAANDNIKLSPQQREELRALAEETARVEEANRNLKDAMDFAKDAAKGFMSDMMNGLRQGKSVWEAFGDAALNVLNKILDKMLDLAINTMFSSGPGGGGGFLTSLFQSLFSGFRANGGPVQQGRGYIVGERGPEYFIPSTAGSVVPNNVMARQGNGGGGVVVNIINNTKSEVKTKENQSSGGKTFDIVIDEMVADRINTPGSASRRALTSNGALSPQLARR